MTLRFQVIRCSNGEAFRGDYLTIISSGELEAGGSTSAVSSDLPFRYDFELHLSPNGYMVMVATFFDHEEPRYRHGQRFRKVDAIRQFLERYDACLHLPIAAAGNRDLRQALTTRYAEQCERFLREAEDRLTRVVTPLGRKKTNSRTSAS